jgi:DNA-binding response OmpR family regulator
MVRILLAEDDPAHALLTELAFREVAAANEPVEVRVCTTGHEAIAALAGPPPDLVVLDARLPGTSGFEVLAAIRATPRWATTPVVILSMSDREEDRQRAKALGASDYLIKPLGLDALEALLRGVVARWVVRQ